MRRERGFTLMELMFAIAVAAIILAVGVPSFRQFMMNSRMTQSANDLMSAIYLARSESIKQHTQTVMCFTSTPDAATPACDGNGQQGWIVFVDAVDPETAAATDNNGQLDAGERILARHGPIASGITLRSSPAGNDGYVAYNAAGFSRPTPLGVDMGASVLCDSRGNTEVYGATHSAARAVVVSATGRPAVTRAVADIAALGGCP